MTEFMTYLGEYFRDLAQGFVIKGPLACLGSCLAGFLGGWDQLIDMLFLLMCVDFLLGFWRAWHRRAFSMKKLKRGLVKFIFYALAVMVFVALDAALAEVAGSLVRIPMRDLVIIYLCVCETLSAVKHLTAFGVPFPAALISSLESFRDDGGKGV